MSPYRAKFKNDAAHRCEQGGAQDDIAFAAATGEQSKRLQSQAAPRGQVNTKLMLEEAEAAAA